MKYWDRKSRKSATTRAKVAEFKARARSLLPASCEFDGHPSVDAIAAELQLADAVLNAGKAWADAWGVIWEGNQDQGAQDELNDASKSLYDAICDYNRNVSSEATPPIVYTSAQQRMIPAQIRRRLERALETAKHFKGQSAGSPKMMLEISDVDYLLKWLDRETKEIEQLNQFGGQMLNRLEDLFGIEHTANHGWSYVLEQAEVEIRRLRAAEQNADMDEEQDMNYHGRHMERRSHSRLD